MLEEIKMKAAELGRDDRCDGYGKNGYYQVIDFLIECFPDSVEKILDNGKMLYDAYSESFN